MSRLSAWFALFILVAHTAFGADIVVYDDSSHNPPFDQACSFGGVAADFNFANTAPVHSGSDSIRFIPEQYNAVSWCGNTTYSTSSYSAITFWVYLGSAAQGDTIDFAALQAAGLIETRAVRAKIVLKGELKRAIKLKGVAATAGAKAAIEAAGGSVE